MKIVIEGMDGSGKSTVAKEVAQRIGAKYVDGMLTNFFLENGMSQQEVEVIRKAIELCSDNENSILRTWVYGYANLFNLMHYNENVVIDRHCITTYFYNGDEESQELYKYMQKIMGKPDLVVILHASEDTRRTRILARNSQDPDLLDEKKLQYGYDRIEEAAKFLELDYQIVYTDNKNVSQVTEEVLRLIRK